jgi:hypothetical protein
MRSVFLLAGCLVCGVSAAQSLHLSAAGAVVSGSFQLAGKTIPLPAGEFVLAAARIEEARVVQGNISRPRATIASVFLAQLDGQWLKSAVWASAVLEPPAPRANWVQAREPCAREGTLFRRDLAQDASHGEHAHHNCLVVQRRVRNFDAAATGIFKDAAAWLAYHDVLLPVRILIVADITRIERRELVRAAYAFHPASYGCTTPSPAFVDSITAWGKGVQQHFDNVIAGRASAAFSSGIHQCASAVASSP